MLQILLGVACGILLSLFFSFGPAFFSLLQNSIHYGFKRAFPFVIGICFCDAAIVFLLLTVFADTDMTGILNNIYVASIGGAVLAGLGFFTFTRKAQDASSQGSLIKFKRAEPRGWAVLLRGFVTNFINPLIWIYWVSIITVIAGGSNSETGELYLFFAGVLATVFGLDTLKCKLASMLQRVITAKVLNRLNKITGVIMFGFAVYLVASMIVYQAHPERRVDQSEHSPSNMVKKIIETGDTIKYRHPQMILLKSDSGQTDSNSNLLDTTVLQSR